MSRASTSTPTRPLRRKRTHQRQPGLIWQSLYRPHAAEPHTDANQSLSGRASTPTPNQVSQGKSSAFTPTPHRAEPLHQRQPGLTGQSFHTNSNKASLGRASEPTPTRPHWAEPLHQHQPGLIGQSLSTNGTPTSTRGLHLVPLTSRPGNP